MRGSAHYRLCAKDRIARLSFFLDPFCYRQESGAEKEWFCLFEVFRVQRDMLLRMRAQDARLLALPFPATLLLAHFLLVLFSLEHKLVHCPLYRRPQTSSRLLNFFPAVSATP